MNMKKLFLLLLVVLSSQVNSVGFLSPTEAYSGTFTPTCVGVANVASCTANQFFYTRVGNIVNVAGSVTVTASVTNTLTQYTLTFPAGLSSTFTTTYDASGVGNAPGGTQYRAAKVYAITTPSPLVQVDDFTSGISSNDTNVVYQYVIK